jgi:hypothetical protein
MEFSAEAGNLVSDLIFTLVCVPNTNITGGSISDSFVIHYANAKELYEGKVYHARTDKMKRTKLMNPHVLAIT